MYKIFTENSKAEKNLRNYLDSRKDVKEKLNRLKSNPFRELGAHPLHGKLKGKWACWLGANIRIIYRIHVENKQIIIQADGSHKIY